MYPVVRENVLLLLRTEVNKCILLASLSIPLIEMQGSIQKAVENDIMLLTANIMYSTS